MPQNLKPLLMTDSDVFAGTERHILELAEGLQKQEINARIACPMPSALGQKAKNAGVDVIAIQKGGMVDRPAIAALSQLLISGQVNLIHAHNGRSALQATLAIRRAGTGRCILTQHFLEPANVTRRGFKGIASRLAHRWMNRRIDHAIAISNAVRTAMLTRRELTESKITVVPNGIADPKALPSKLPQGIREELKILQDVPLVVCAARLEREKNIDTLVAAMAGVAGFHPSAVCVIAGEGSQKQALVERVNSLGLEKTIRFPGFREDAISIIAAADIFVLPSIAEPFGLVILEAMALGKPVIATNAGGPKEIVADGQTGLLLPPCDPAAMLMAISSLLSDSSRARALGYAGRERYVQHYTAERMVSATADVYMKTLSS